MGMWILNQVLLLFFPLRHQTEILFWVISSTYYKNLWTYIKMSVTWHMSLQSALFFFNSFNLTNFLNLAGEQWTWVSLHTLIFLLISLLHGLLFSAAQSPLTALTPVAFTHITSTIFSLATWPSDALRKHHDQRRPYILMFKGKESTMVGSRTRWLKHKRGSKWGYQPPQLTPINALLPSSPKDELLLSASTSVEEFHNLPRQCHQLKVKNSNSWAQGGHFSFKWLTPAP